MANPDPREDLESRSPNLGPYTTKGFFIGASIKGSTFWIFPGIWEYGAACSPRVGVESICIVLQASTHESRALGRVWGGLVQSIEVFEISGPLSRSLYSDSPTI